MLIVFVIATLFLISVVNAVIFNLLLNRQVNLKESYKLTTVASALNKALFTGSGYLASSYFSRTKAISFYRALSAFFVLEVLSVFLWVVLGVYFGARLAVDIPFLLVVIMFFIALIVRRKKHTLASSLRGYIGHFKTLRTRIFLVLPYFVLNTVLGFVYYVFLFRFFGIDLDIFTVVKIVSIAFTIGYLSFSPTGLGIKEAGIVVLLADHGVDYSVALPLALVDRFLTTGFFAFVASIVGWDLIKEEFRRRFSKDDKDKQEREELLKRLKDVNKEETKEQEGA